MLTVVTTRPPSTYTFTTSLQFNSILEKLYSLLLHVESNRFLVLLKFLSCCYSCCCCRKERVTTIAIGVVGGSFAFLTTNQARTNEVGTLESKCQNFFLSPILFLQVVGCKKKNKTKQKRCSATLAGVVTRCWTSQHRCEVQCVVGHRSTVARSNALLQERRIARSNALLQERCVARFNALLQ
jgi:hypothetical protein